jgi:hypothetical protein
MFCVIVICDEHKICRPLNAHLDTVDDLEPSALINGSNIPCVNPPFVILRLSGALRIYRL